jgi:hypothetical protein
VGLRTPASDTYAYEGAEISETAAQNLVCVETATENRCFANVFDAEAGMGTGSPAARADGDPAAEAAITERVEKGDLTTAQGEGLADASECVYAILYTWKNPSYQVYGGSLSAFNVWANFNASNDQTTTSFITGEGSAHLAGHLDGGGYWYPGNTGYCVGQPNLQGTGWNNRIRSRYRY